MRWPGPLTGWPETDLHTLLGRMLQPLYAAGEEEQLTRAVRLLWIAMHGVWTLDAGGKLFIVTNDPVEKVAHEMVDLFLAGLRARGS